MNRKQLLLLVVVLVVLGGAALALLKRDADTRRVGSGAGSIMLLGELPVGEELAQFIIKEGTNTLTLTKQAGVWCVEERGNYPADYAEISRAVLELRDLKAGQVEEVGPAQLARLELLDPATGEGGGTLIEFRDKDGQMLGSLLLGKTQTRKESAPSPFGGGEPSEVPVGRWVMNPTVQTRAALVGKTFSDLEARPEDWLDDDFFKVQKIKSVEVTYPDEATNCFQLSRETESGEWMLADLADSEELDTTKTSGFNYALSNPSFNDVIVDGDEAELGLDQPTVIRIETFEGFRYEIKAGEKTNNTIPLRVAVKGTYAHEREAAENEDESVKVQQDKEFAETLKSRDEKLEREQALEPWTYLVSSWTLDSVLKKRSELVRAKEPKEPEAEPEELETPVDAIEGLLDLPSAE